MDWIKDISKAISYIEDNITEEMTIDDIANEALVSSFYFQKGFAMLCGHTVFDYVRQRRLSLAGEEVAHTDKKIIDIAMRYGYESPDSFTKAFYRFHKATPTAVRKSGALIKSFAPLKIKFALEGGYIMDYKIIEKKEFKVIGDIKTFTHEEAVVEIPSFWENHYKEGKGEIIHGMYGISIAESMEGKNFDYMIADDYDSSKEMPKGFVVKSIPAHTWAVFPCKGPMPKSIQEVNQKIFSEWLPNCKDYEIAAGYSIEMYTDTTQCPKGTMDENYYSEVWIPIKKK